MKISNEQLKNLADEKYLERGKSFYEKGWVELAHTSESQVDGIVLGNTSGFIYYPKLFKAGDDVQGSCTCLSYLEGDGPCKHMAALAYSVMDDDYKISPEYFVLKEDTEKRIEELRKENKDALITKILKLEHQLQKQG